MSASMSIHRGDYSNRDTINIRDYKIEGSLTSTMGRALATSCTLKDVSGRDGVVLNGTRAKDVTSSMGKVHAISCKLKEVKGRDGVELEKTTAKGVTSSEGIVRATECEELKNVSGRDGVRVEKTTAKDVTSSMGKVVAILSKLRNVSGRDGVSLNGTTAGTVTSSQGNVFAVSSSVTAIFARDDAQLYDTTADSVNVSMGKLTVRIVERGSIKYPELKSRDGMELTQVIATKVIVSMGQLTLSLSNIITAECRQHVKCETSTVNELLLHVSPQKPGVIELGSSSAVLGSVSVKKLETSGSAAPYGSSRGISSSTRVTFLDIRTEASPSQDVSSYPASSSQDVSSGEVILEVRGGTICQNIQFIECVGKVKLLEGAVLRGEIISGSRID